MKLEESMAGPYFETVGTCSKLVGTIFTIEKNKIPIKILAGKRSIIGIIVEFCGIPSGFPKQDGGGQRRRTTFGRMGGWQNREG
jgi:hypothetical protein